MSNLTITNVDVGGVIIRGAEFEDALLTFAGAGTVYAGTILARDSSTLKYIPFVKGGTTNENGIPKAIITHDITAAGAGDETFRPMISGDVVKERLIIVADGDDTNVDAAVRDELRDYGIVVINVEELNELDNQ
jgi:hypothetical protein